MSVTLKVFSAKKVLDSYSIVQGDALVIQASKKANYQLIDEQTGFAPQNIIAKRQGKDLNIFLEDGDMNADIVIQGYYGDDKSEYVSNLIVGQHENGGIYAYVPESGEKADAVSMLNDESSAPQALGGDELVNIFWAFNPWWLLSLLPVAAGILLATSKKGSHSKGKADEPVIDIVDGAAKVTPGSNNEKLVINYVDKNNEPKTATLIKDNNGKWQTNDPDVVINDDNTITIPSDKLKDGSVIKVTGTDGSGNNATTEAVVPLDPADKPIIESPDNDGRIIVTPGDDNVRVEITFNDEDGNPKTVIAEKDKNGNWVITNDDGTGATIENGKIVIPADKVKDGDPIKAKGTNDAGNSADTDTIAGNDEANAKVADNGIEAPETVNEGDELVVKVTLTNNNGREKLPFEVGGRATADDFVGEPSYSNNVKANGDGTLSIPKGVKEFTITYQVKADNQTEGDENVTFGSEGKTAETVIKDTSQTGDANPPTVAQDPNNQGGGIVTPGENNTQVEITFPNENDEPQTVTITKGKDNKWTPTTPLPEGVRVDPNTGVVTIGPDAVKDGGKVTATGSEPKKNPATGTGTMTDDAPNAKVADNGIEAPETVNEGDELVVKVTLTNNNGREKLPFEVGGRATADDFVGEPSYSNNVKANGDGTLSIPKGVKEFTITYQVKADNQTEGDENVTFGSEGKTAETVIKDTSQTGDANPPTVAQDPNNQGGGIVTPGENNTQVEITFPNENDEPQTVTITKGKDNKWTPTTPLPEGVRVDPNTGVVTIGPDAVKDGGKVTATGSEPKKNPATGTGTMTDDAPNAKVADNGIEAPETVNEGDELVVKVTLTNNNGREKLPFEVGGRATADDFVGEPSYSNNVKANGDGTLSIPKGVKEFTITYQVKADNQTEGDENVTFGSEGKTAETVIKDTSQTGDANPPTVAQDPNNQGGGIVTPGENNTQVEITFPNENDEPQTVTITKGKDNKWTPTTPLPEGVRVDPNTGVVTIGPDAVKDGGKVTATGSEPKKNPATGTGTMTDDAPNAKVADNGIEAPETVNEGDELVVKVTLTNNNGREKLPFEVGGRATADDFVGEPSYSNNVKANGDGTLSIPKGVKEFTITYQVKADNQTEGDENVTFGSEGKTAETVIKDTSQTGDANPPTVAQDPNNQGGGIVTPGENNTQVEITFPNENDEPQTVTITKGKDNKWTPTTPLPEGVRVDPNTGVVTIGPDAVKDGGKVTATGSEPKKNPATGTGTMTDDAPNAKVADNGIEAPETVNEGDELVVKVTLTNNNGREKLPFEVGGRATADDFVGEPSYSNNVKANGDGTLSIPKGVKEFTITYQVKADNQTEGDENVTFGSEGKTAETVIKDTSQTGDANPPTVAQDPNNQGGGIVTPGENNTQVEITFPNENDEPQTVTITKGKDNKWTPTTPLPEGVRVDPNTGVVTIGPDAVKDGGKVTATGSEPKKNPATGTGTMTDDAPNAKVADNGIEAPETVNEGDELVVKVTLTNNNGREKLPFEVGGRATADDFVGEPSYSNNVKANGDGTLSIPKGVKEFTITYQVKADNQTEGDENVTFGSEGKTAETVIKDTSQTGDANPPTVAQDPNNQGGGIVTPGENNTQVEITFPNENDEPQTVTITKGKDNKWTPTTPLPEGVRVDPNTGVVTIGPDAVKDGGKVTATGSEPKKNPATGTGTMTDDAPNAKVADNGIEAPETVNEGDELVVKVTLTNNNGREKLPFEVGGRATADDFVGEPSYSNNVKANGDGTLSIPKGVKEFTITYQVKADNQTEGDENVTFGSEGKTAETVIKDTSQTGDANPPTVAQDPNNQGGGIVTPGENNTQVEITFPNENDEPQTVTITKGKDNKWTPTTPLPEGVRVDPNTGVVTIGPDAVKDGGKVTATGSEPKKNPATGTGTMTDDAPNAKVADNGIEAPETVNEGDELVVKVTLTNNNGREKLPFEVGGRATADDFVGEPSYSNNVKANGDGTLSIPKGVKEFTITYQVKADNQTEGDENVTFGSEGKTAETVIKDTSQTGDANPPTVAQDPNNQGGGIVTPGENNTQVEITFPNENDEPQTVTITKGKDNKWTPTTPLPEGVRVDPNTGVVTIGPDAVKDGGKVTATGSEPKKNPATGTGTMTDDAPNAKVADNGIEAPETVNEGDELVVKVTLTNNNGREKLPFEVGGRATADDFVGEPSYSNNVKANGDGTLSIPKGVKEFTITYQVKADNQTEGDENVTFGSEGKTAETVIKDTSQTGDANPPTVAQDPNNQGGGIVTPGENNTQVEITFPNENDEPQTVTITKGKDNKWTPTTPLPEGVRVDPNTGVVTIGPDAVKDGGKVTATGSEPKKNPATGTGTMTDDAPNAKVADNGIEAPETVNEGDELVVKVTLTNNNGREKLPFEVGGRATADDFVGEPSYSNNVKANGDGTLSIPKGVKEFTITYQVKADNQTEGDENVTFGSEGKTAETVIKDTSQTGDANPPTVAQDPNNQGGGIVTPGENNTQVEITFPNENDEPQTVTITKGKDNKWTPTTPLPEGVRVDPNTGVVTIGPDAVKDGGKVTATGSEPKKNPATGTGTMTDDAPNAKVADNGIEAPETVNEGDELVVKVTLTNNNGREKLPFEVGGRATADDFVGEPSYSNNVKANGDGTLSIPKGVKEFTITYQVKADNQTEGDENVTFGSEGKTAETVIKDTSQTGDANPPTVAQDPNNQGGGIVTPGENNTQVEITFPNENDEPQTVTITKGKDNKWTPTTPLPEGVRVDPNTGVVTIGPDAVKDGGKVTATGSEPKKNPATGTGTMTDDAPNAKVADNGIEAPETVNEGDELVVKVTLTNNNGREKLPFEVGGRATADDFVGEPSYSNNVKANGDGTLSIPKGVKEFTITYQVKADNQTEGDENVTFGSEGKTAETVIKDTSTAAQATSIEAPEEVNEGSPLVVTVNLNNGNGNSRLPFNREGTANDEDFDGEPTYSNGVTKNDDGSLKVPEGVESFTVTYQVKADEKTEGEETAVFSSGEASKTTKIKDSSTTPLAQATSIEAPDEVNEGSPLVVTVNLNNGNGNSRLPFNREGTANDEDFDGEPTYSNGVTKNDDGSLKVPEGVESFTVTYQVKADEKTEGEETAVFSSGEASKTTKIKDSSTTPLAQATSIEAPDEVNEGSPLVVTVNLDNRNGNSRLPFNREGTANDEDFDGEPTYSNGVTKNDDGSLNVPANVENFTVTYNVKADNITEGNEKAVFTSGSARDETTIKDTSKPAAQATGIQTPDTVNEGENLTVTFTLDNANGNPALPYRVHGNIDWGDLGDPIYSDGVTQTSKQSSTINVPEGVTTFTITYPVVEDNVKEGDETAKFTSGSATDQTVIKDTSRPSEAASIDAPDEVNEGSPLVVTVNLDNRNGNSRLPFNREGTANDEDFDGEPTYSNGVTKNDDGSLNVPANVENFTVTYNVKADNITEGNEKAVFTSGSARDETTIKDTSKPAAQATGIQTPDTVNEGENLTVTFTLDNANGNPALPYRVHGNIDWGDLGDPIYSDGVTQTSKQSSTINVPEGVTTFTITYPVVEDNVKEGDETAKFTSGSATDQTVIKDTSRPSEAASIDAPDEVNEGSPLVVTVNLDNRNGNSRLPFNREGTANDEDFDGEPTYSNGVTKNDDGSLNVPANVENFTVTYNVKADNITEGNEKAVFTSGSARDETTIKDTSKPAAQATGIQTPDTVNEGENLTVTFTLDNANGNPALPYRVHGNIDWGDLGDPIYSDGVTQTSKQSSTINVPEGVTTFTITYPVVEDNVKEGDETAKFTSGSATDQTVIKDTSRPSEAASIDAPEEVNEGSPLVVTVNLDNRNGNSRLPFNREGTANDEDFDGEPTYSNGVTKNDDGSLNVPANVENFTVTYNVKADNITEGNEKAVFTSGSASDETTIKDTSTTPLAQATSIEAPETVNEGSDLVVTVNLSNRNGNSNLPFSRRGTADNDDFNGEPTYSNGVTKNDDGSLNVPANVENFTVTYQVKADEKTEGEESAEFASGSATKTTKIVDTSIDVLKKLAVSLNSDSVGPGGTDQDKITNDRKIWVDNLRAGQQWEYSIDGGKTWQSGGTAEGERASFDLPANRKLLGVKHSIIARVEGAGEATQSDRLDMILDMFTKGHVGIGVDPNNKRGYAMSVYGEPNASYEVFRNGSKVGSGRLNSKGEGTTSLRGFSLKNPQGYSVKIMDKAGNEHYAGQPNPLKVWDMPSIYGTNAATKGKGSWGQGPNLNNIQPKLSNANDIIFVGGDPGSKGGWGDVGGSIYADNLHLDTKGGDDAIFAAAIQASSVQNSRKPVRVSTGDGDDIIALDLYVTALAGGHLYINMGTGDDVLVAKRAIGSQGIGAKVDINMGDGDDKIISGHYEGYQSVDNIGASSPISIQMGNGDDIFEGSKGILSRNGKGITIDGGYGYDILDIGGVGIVRAEYRGWEKINLKEHGSAMNLTASDLRINADTKTVVNGEEYDIFVITGTGTVDLGGDGRRSKGGFSSATIPEGLRSEYSGYSAFKVGGDDTLVLIQNGINII